MRDQTLGGTARKFVNTQRTLATLQTTKALDDEITHQVAELDVYITATKLAFPDESGVWRCGRCL